MRLWERIRKDSHDFGRGFVRLWERIHKTLGNPQKCHKKIVPIFICMSMNISAVFIYELVGCIQLTR